MKKGMNVFLGIDYGTGGCKVTAIGEDGSFVGEASTEFATSHDHPGWSEQDPQDWWNALAASLKKLAGKGVDLKSVAACALDGSTHNAVLLDAGYKPVRRTIMWTDQRSTAECDALKAGWGEKIFSTCYQMPAPTWTLPQMMWLKANEPDALAKTEHVLFVKDYVRYLLTGEAATDYIEAQGTLMWAMSGESGVPGVSGAWDEELVALSGLRLSAMPRIISPTDIAGRVTREAAEFTGLPEGMPVVCGSSDSAVEDYGAGAVEPGDLIIKLATAGNVNSMTAAAHPHPKTLTYSHIVPGMWYSVSATNAAALCMRWLRDTFYAVGRGGGGQMDLKDVYAVIDGEAGASPVGANGVFFHPYLQGERCPYWGRGLHFVNTRRLREGVDGGGCVFPPRLLPHAGGDEAARESDIPHRRRRTVEAVERDSGERVQLRRRCAGAGRRELRRLPSRGDWRRRLRRRQGGSGEVPAHQQNPEPRPRCRGCLRPPLHLLPPDPRRPRAGVPPSSMRGGLEPRVGFEPTRPCGS